MLYLHVAVMLFGLAGLFGKFLTLPAVVIVFGRTVFAAAALGLLGLFVGQGRGRISPSELAVICVQGLVLAVHWVTFFYSVQISTVAVGLISFSTFPVFVTFLEPLCFDEKLRSRDVILSFVVFAGLLLVVPEFEISNSVTRGVLWGTISGFTFAMLSLLNRQLSKTHSARFLALSQNLVAALCLVPFLSADSLDITSRDLLYLFVLGVLCTALSHTFFINALVTIRAQTASVVAALEPVYGILFALLLLGEIPSGRTLVGGTVILVATIAASFFHYNASQSRTNESISLSRAEAL